MKILLRFIQYLILLPFHLLSALTCWVLSPILPLFAIGRETLPNWLSWFQTPDAPLDGDSGFQKLYLPEKWPRYIRRMMWLWRNPSYGFAWTVLAFQPTSGEFTWKGTISIEQQRNSGSGFGWYFITTPQGYFQFAFRKPMPWGKQLRFRFGWKIVGLACWGIWKEKQKFVFTFNPFDGG